MVIRTVAQIGEDACFTEWRDAAGHALAAICVKVIISSKGGSGWPYYSRCRPAPSILPGTLVDVLLCGQPEPLSGMRFDAGARALKRGFARPPIKFQTRFQIFAGVELADALVRITRAIIAGVNSLAAGNYRTARHFPSP